MIVRHVIKEIGKIKDEKIREGLLTTASEIFDKHNTIIVQKQIIKLARCIADEEKEHTPLSIDELKKVINKIYGVGIK